MRRARVKPGSADVLDRGVNEVAAPMMNSIPGFSAYYVVYGEDDTVIVLDVFKDKATSDLLLGGILLAAWAVAAVKDEDIERPAAIITSGPYAFSRNPMYLAWTIIYAGIVVLVNTWWLVLLLPVLLLFTHYLVVRQEERQLEQQFGEPYRQYCARVRRYL